MPLERLRILEIIGGLIGCAYAALGIVQLLELSPSRMTLVRLMDALATRCFLVFFGFAAACACLIRSSSVACRFGFLVTWTGRGIFFLLMGFYVFPTVCRYSTVQRCLRYQPMVAQCAVLASLASVAIGATILALRCLVMREDCSGSITGTRRSLQTLELCCTAGSCGMILLGLLWAYDLSIVKYYYATDACYHFAITTIVLIFGTTSLMSSLRASSWVAIFFGYLEVAWMRGVFYFLMGCYMFAESYSNFSRKESLSNTVCVICSVLSMAAGVVNFILGCG